MISLLEVSIPIGENLGDFFAYDGSQDRDLGTLVSNVVEVILIVALFLALFYLLIGGVNWITAEGKPEKLEKARNQITQAITGLAIAIGSWAIWLLVVKQFLGIDITGGINLGPS